MRHHLLHRLYERHQNIVLLRLIPYDLVLVVGGTSDEWGGM